MLSYLTDMYDRQARLCEQKMGTRFERSGRTVRRRRKRKVELRAS